MSLRYRIMRYFLEFVVKIGLMRLMAKGFRYVALTGVGSESCLKEGFLPVPVHFYSPIPDISDLRQRDVWSKCSDLAGIDFRPDQQIGLLRELGASFGQECQWPDAPDGNPETFYLNNPSFSFGCAAATHGLIRQFKPQRIIEVGSGMSTRVIRAALAKNFEDSGVKADYSVVDPYPSDATRNLLGENLIRQRVELLDVGLFSKLQNNDILFIDSSHSVKIGSDVNYLFLDVLPRLSPGVLVHIHDISLPYEYTKVYATNHYFRQFWTEQYLLQSFLSCNNDFEVLLGLHYLMTDQPAEFKHAFPYYNSDIHPAISGSFWIRRNN